jgi:hypothetical protein
MKHKIEIAPNLAIVIDGERVIGSKPRGLFLTTEMIVSDEDLKRLADRCLEVISDSKTDPSNSEKPNNCEVKNYCDDCLYTDTCDSKAFFYACTSKATISKMEQVDKDINVRSKDEPQTELVRVKYHCINCAENGSYKCSKCDGEMYYKYDKDEPQTDCDHRCIQTEIGCEKTDCAWK